MTNSKPNPKARTLHEFARFATMFAYLWAMFGLFQIHQYVVLAQQHIPFTQFGVAFLNALVLAKVMLVADDLRLGEWRGRRPLIYPVLLRSALFAVVFIVFDIVEKTLIGVFHGKAVAESIETPGRDGILGVILVAIIIAVALVPFFAFVEVGRLMDPGELTRILLYPRTAGIGPVSLTWHMIVVVQNETAPDLSTLILAAGVRPGARSPHHPLRFVPLSQREGRRLDRGRVSRLPSRGPKGPRPVSSSCSSREQINWRRVAKIQMNGAHRSIGRIGGDSRHSNVAALHDIHPSGTPALRMSSMIRSRRFKKSGLSLCAPAR